MVYKVPNCLYEWSHHDFILWLTAWVFDRVKCSYWAILKVFAYKIFILNTNPAKKKKSAID